MVSARVSRDQRWWHVVLRYLLPVVLFGAVLGLSLFLERIDFKLNLTIPIVFALVATVWWGGRGPGILISLLFQGATIVYATIPPGQSVGRAWFGYASVFSLYIFLVLVIGYLKTARDRITEQRDLLHVTLSSIGDAVIATDPAGMVTFMNPVAEAMTGWRQLDAKDRSIEAVFNVVDEITEKRIENPVERVQRTGGVAGLANHTILISKSGTRLPIEDCAAPILHGEEVKGVILVFSDVTERKQAERSQRETEIMTRLVEAQESERHRIARDLHDHLGQRMTALRLKLGSLKDECTSADDVGRAVTEIESAAETIDRDIGFLSWELRPTELEELGLENALGTFVREWSTQYGIKADFHAAIGAGKEDAGRFSAEIETNLYRVTQEALNNIVKHARATSVNVLLQRDRNDLLLIIEDDGSGFHEHTNGNGRGLGVVGMRERAALLHGTLSIDSSDEGTTVIVRIPVTEDADAH
jgi:PAS domain S-box-containing protein